MAKSMDTMKCGNFWVPLIYNIPCCDNIEDAVPYIKKQSQDLVGSRLTNAARLFGNISASLPYYFPPHMMWLLTSKYSFGYSNFPGNKNGYNWGGVQVRSITAFAPTIGCNANGIICLTLADVLTIGYISCLNQIKEPDTFMQLLERNFTEFMYPEAI